MAFDDFNNLIAADFQIIIDDIGTFVTLNRFTQVNSNITGEEDIDNGYGSNVSIKAVFELNTRSHDLQREGIFEGANAALYSKPSDNVRKDDKITFDGKTYLVRSKTKRNSVDFCLLELWVK